LPSCLHSTSAKRRYPDGKTFSTEFESEVIGKVDDAGETDLPAIVRIYNFAVSTHNSTSDTEPVSVESQREWLREHDPKRRLIFGHGV
jgi:hypothetical protein